VFDIFLLQIKIGCASSQTRLVGMNPVQIRATMELYPDIRPSRQGEPAGECFVFVSIVLNSY